MSIFLYTYIHMHIYHLTQLALALFFFIILDAKLEFYLSQSFGTSLQRESHTDELSDLNIELFLVPESKKIKRRESGKERKGKETRERNRGIKTILCPQLKSDRGRGKSYNFRVLVLPEFYRSKFSVNENSPRTEKKKKKKKLKRI